MQKLFSDSNCNHQKETTFSGTATSQFKDGHGCAIDVAEGIRLLLIQRLTSKQKEENLIWQIRSQRHRAQLLLHDFHVLAMLLLQYIHVHFLKWARCLWYLICLPRFSSGSLDVSRGIKSNRMLSAASIAQGSQIKLCHHAQLLLIQCSCYVIASI